MRFAIARDLTMTLRIEVGAEPIAGYTLVRLLGRGGFGEVWEAVAPGEVRVALKFIRLDSSEADIEQRALKVIRDIRHPHLLDVQFASRVGDCLVIAMPLCDESLLDRLRACQKQGLRGLPRAELHGYMEDLARAVDYLNEPRHPTEDGTVVGVQHRDIKPHNIFLVGDSVRLADFGLAKVLHASKRSHTGSMSVDYVPPEVPKGQVTRWSDQYSLAATYLHLRTGKLPFEGDSPVQILYAHMHTPPDLSGLPDEERPVVARALAKRPEDRWPTCRAFAHALTVSAREDDFRSQTGGGTGPRTDVRVGPLAEPEVWDSTQLPEGNQSTFGAGERVEKIPETTGLPPTLQALIKEAPPLALGARKVASGPKRPWPARLVGLAATLLGLVVAIPGLVALILVFGPKFAGNDSGSAGGPVSDPGPWTTPRPPPMLKSQESQEAPLKTVEQPTTKNVKTDVKDDPPKKRLIPRVVPPRKNVPSEPPKRITSKTGMVLVLIPAGRFDMGSPDSDKDANGSEKPRHPVRITRPFYLGATEVTQGQYRAVTGANPSHFKESDDHPVEQVSWNEAIEFCDKLSKLDGLTPYYGPNVGKPSGGEGYRLPTEAEWEYACRAGSTTRFGFGDDAAMFGQYAWYKDNSGHKTNPVGRKRPNAFGLFDMHGNVSEWCGDVYDAKYYSVSVVDDPPGPSLSQASGRVIRGGTWLYDPRTARSANRHGHTPGFRYDYLGFRLARGQSGAR
jgi:formylglycine-generating enzyme required for sulfatase activity/serine/threonine protein kinase